MFWRKWGGGVDVSGCKEEIFRVCVLEQETDRESNEGQWLIWGRKNVNRKGGGKLEEKAVSLRSLVMGKMSFHHEPKLSADAYQTDWHVSLLKLSTYSDPIPFCVQNKCTSWSQKSPNYSIFPSPHCKLRVNEEKIREDSSWGSGDMMMYKLERCRGFTIIH